MDSIYRRLLEFTGDGVYRYTFDDGQVLLANQGLVDILALDCRPEEIVGKYLKDLLVYTEKAGTVRETLEREGEIHRFEYQFKTLTGEDRWVIHDSLLVEDPITHRRVVDAIVKDITSRKLAEERLETLVRQRTAELQRSNQELEQFAYAASHDLQEPLRKILAFGDRLETHCAAALDEQGRDYLARLTSATQRMQNFINDLLEYSRVTTRGRPFETVDLTEVMREALSDLDMRIQESNAEVQVGELPRLDADRLQLRQLFQNLLSNALKFHREKEPPRVEITGACVEEEGRPFVRVTITDHGIGFEDRFSERIFGIFQRLHAREEYEGTGIGLALCRRIVQRHGGRIEARGRPGEGAVFAVLLPQKPEIER